MRKEVTLSDALSLDSAGPLGPEVSPDVWMERAGEAVCVRSSFVGGVKRAPMRWELRSGD
jgi:hypothetical protein